MIRKLTLTCLVFGAPALVGCLDVTPIAPSPAFEAMIAAASDTDGGEDGGDGGDGDGDGGGGVEGGVGDAGGE